MNRRFAPKGGSTSHYTTVALCASAGRGLSRGAAEAAQSLGEVAWPTLSVHGEKPNFVLLHPPLTRIG